MENESKPSSWWKSVPGTITAWATMLTAVVGALIALNELGVFKGRGDAAAEQAATGEPASPSSPVDDVGAAAGPVKAVSAEMHQIDKPLHVTIGTTYKLTLAENEESYFIFTAPGVTRLVLDARLVPKDAGYISDKVQLLDQDAVPIGSPLVILSAADHEYRMIETIPLKRGDVRGLKVVNQSQLTDLWLTLQPEGETRFVPLFGDVAPRSFKPGQVVSNTLEQHQNIYFIARFARGNYKIIVDAASTGGRNGYLGMSMSTMDALGGNQQSLVRVSQVGTSHRQSATLNVARDQLMIFRLYGASSPVDFQFRMAPS